ncbi:hypothetical protein L1987_30053 [Smallanthus sonchifolius]|uniref:Uncharacterized protein n=1 Tax=Smallanthus sonchifolius TaxID=185202 RepID=A0ACB9I1T0_9ASTR|nr:hypothetical protein L1987_30053 [Smallanthus sonchifolius]
MLLGRCGGVLENSGLVKWEELSGVLSVVKNNALEGSPTMNLSFSEDDFIIDAYSNHDGNIIGHETSSRQSSMLFGSMSV